MQVKSYGFTAVSNLVGSRFQNIILLLSAAGILTLFLIGNASGLPFESLVKRASGAALPSTPPVTNSAAPGPLNVSQLVEDALAFYNSLNSTQQADLQLNYSATLARKWSNLPCGASCRNGVKLGSLTSAQLALAQQVIADALGTDAENGSQEYSDITTAEDYLGSVGSSSQYNSGLRWMAFLNTPSETGAWMLQFGGHHYAANIAINNGHVIGSTPFFVALEPSTFTYNGTSYGPMEDERNALRAMLASLSASELATAKLNSTFNDCLMSPGESNGNNNTFPATKQGIAVSSLTTTQKDLVLAAIQNYVADMDPTTAASVMARYTDEIDATYIAYTGNGTSGNGSSFLTSSTNYVRIDGPTVWIEFACQNGIVIQGQIHYHSVWRDHAHDYGVDLSGDPIDDYTSTSTGNIKISNAINIYPNPSNGILQIALPEEMNQAKVTVMDILGKVIFTKIASGKKIDLEVKSLPAGNYQISVQDKTHLYTGKFIRN